MLIKKQKTIQLPLRDKKDHNVPTYIFLYIYIYNIDIQSNLHMLKSLLFFSSHKPHINLTSHQGMNCSIVFTSPYGKSHLNIINIKNHRSMVGGNKKRASKSIKRLNK